MTDSPPEPRPRLLVVDDEDGPRQSLLILFARDCEVTLAKNGEEALAKAREQIPDAAIVDIRMPGMDGIAVLKELKAIDPAIEVMMLTAYETLDTARQALRLGACDYLNKPFDVSTVRSAVANALARRAESRALRENLARLRSLQTEIEEHRLREKTEREKGEIYASVLHDINGPLTVISGYAQMIQHSLAEAAAIEGERLDAIKAVLHKLTQQAVRCIEISRRYLGFLREAGRREQVTPVAQVLQDLSTLLRKHPSLGKHEMVVETAPQAWRAKANGTDLIQILLNLAINALQAGPGDYRVRISAEHFRGDPQQHGPLPVAPAGGTRVADWISLTVQDDGPGMSPEVAARIFDPYFSTKETTGTGLGLAIVKRLAAAAGGAVAVATKPGAGARFTVYFPAA